MKEAPSYGTFMNTWSIRNLKSSVFWDIMSCSPLKVNPTFRRNTLLPSPGSNNKPSKKPANLLRASCCFLLGLFSNHEDGGHTFLWTFNGLHGVIIPEARTLRLSRKLTASAELSKESEPDQRHTNFLQSKHLFWLSRNCVQWYTGLFPTAI
jgi:hypothetical protein